MQGEALRWHKMPIGAVLAYALKKALPCGIVTMLLKFFLQRVPSIDHVFYSLDVEAAAYAGFSTMLGFLIVFRTGEAYNRFWDASTLTHQMRGYWFDALSSMLAFSRYHESEKFNEVLEVRATLVRLFSMLHALALAEMEDTEDVNRWDYDLDVIDPKAFDQESLRFLKSSACKVELVFQWIQCVMVDAMKSELVCAPPPIVTRAFQEVSNGMMKYHECLKISRVPFPLPYRQTTLVLLVTHWIITPVMMCLWTSNPFAALFAALVQVFILWSLHAISQDLENPFGSDECDLDVHEMQREFNRKLLLLSIERSGQIPVLQRSSCYNIGDVPEESLSNFRSVWRDLADDVQNGDMQPIEERKLKKQRRSGEFASVWRKPEFVRGSLRICTLSSDVVPSISRTSEGAQVCVKFTTDRESRQEKPIFEHHYHAQNSQRSQRAGGHVEHQEWTCCASHGLDAFAFTTATNPVASEWLGATRPSVAESAWRKTAHSVSKSKSLTMSRGKEPQAINHTTADLEEAGSCL